MVTTTNRTVTAASLHLVSRRDGDVSTLGASSASVDTNYASLPDEVFLPDYRYFWADLVHEGPNLNGDIFLRDEMERNWRSLLGQVVDLDHLYGVRDAIGKIYAVRFIPDVVAKIRIAAYYNATLYPDVDWKIQHQIIRGVSMECSFQRSTRQPEGRVLRGVSFLGLGIVRIPGDPQAWIETVQDTPATLRAAALQEVTSWATMAAWAAWRRRSVKPSGSISPA